MVGMLYVARKAAPWNLSPGLHNQGSVHLPYVRNLAIIIIINNTNNSHENKRKTSWGKWDGQAWEGEKRGKREIQS